MIHFSKVRKHQNVKMLIRTSTREPFFWLVQLSMFWSFSLGFLKHCEDTTKGLPNGTTVDAEIGHPVSVFFCVKTNEKLSDDVGIVKPSHRGTWIRNTKNNAEEQNVVKSITLEKVTPQDLNVNFSVKIYTLQTSNGQHGLGESIVFTFILREKASETTTKSFSPSRTSTTAGARSSSLSAAGTDSSLQNSKSDSSSEETMTYVYIAVAVFIVIVIAVIIGVLVCRHRGRPMNSKSAYNDELNAYAEIKDSMISPVNEINRKMNNDADDTQVLYANGVTGDNSCGPLISAGTQGESDDGRNISEQGLVYATVAHAAKKDRPKQEPAKLQETRPEEKNSKPAKRAQVVEQVEYTTINLDRSGKCSTPNENVYTNQ